ncbi:TaqI-like C-terminal specificity domain-containing protein [Halorubrum ezzemoulense]|uniref:site-specific DNA-methyltransferase (adenine-specific) n=1 Tax=Halorubrum ezzemoulense TaxID=337243 RepID=A0ABT4Z8D0_HALEZ|nr:TaqI-like C-terminal specificity domain-containing protein [Halorubrum ezzemoulense]MDB2294222.1 TaqI-like C-terminal specificity domain-containing protein [Halorubrum ezzemoulense]
MTDPTNYRTNRDLFSNHYLNDHLHDMEAWTEIPDAEEETAFSEIKSILDEKGDRVEDYNEAQLERNVIRPIFEILEIPFEIEETVMRNARRPDYGFFPSEEAADAAFDRENFYQEAIAVADAKRWGRKLDTRGEEKRDFENPSYQIHSYLQETPPQWGVLTNGEKWRLYYGPTSHRLDSYYEIDLPKVLAIGDEEGDLEAFKEFYLFFRQGAFLDDQTGDCFLDDVYDQSTAFAEALGEDLQENIYEAIRVLAEGFLDTNDNLDEEDLDRIHDSSLIYLYRLIFVLYAESEGRNLLPTENEIYSETYSLNDLKQVVVEKRDDTQQHYQTWQTSLWDKLYELFVLIDQGSQGKGIPKDDLYIPAYNGGMFRTDPEEDDTVEAQFLSNTEVGDAYIAEVIELLTSHEASEGQGKVFVDYSSLDERNLGSIYEGLLEYTLAVADEPLTVDDGEYVAAGEGDDVTVEEDEVYLRTDDGERKATGSYYTAEYVVEYIVDETLGPLVQEIREDLVANSARGDDRGFAEEFADRVFDLTVLDPAMGSGHFPVNAVDYLAREIIDAQEQQDRQSLDSADAEIRAPTTEEGELRDINWARRKVAQRCIYGVDVNPLATELAKVSLWLRTLAAEQPLAFLDHHLKTGNSLVGSDIEDVLSDGDDETETEDGQLTLQQSFDHTRQGAMEHVTDRFQDLLNIDNETLEDAKEMEAVYDDVRADPLYKKLLAMANVHTADAFGLDVPGDADERMARALHSEAWENIEEQDWFKSAQAMAADERFFHWELEFPMAFYDQDGERKADAGFDAVIGNPPYISVENLEDEFTDYLKTTYDATGYGRIDVYLAFIDYSSNLCKNDRRYSMIVPDKWLVSDYGERLRSDILESQTIEEIWDLREESVFDGVSNSPIVFRIRKSEPSNETVYFRSNKGDYHAPQSAYNETYENKIIIGLNEERADVVHKVGGGRERIRDLAYVSFGAQPGSLSKFVFDDFEAATQGAEDLGFSQDPESVVKPFIRGRNIERFEINYDGEYLVYAPEELHRPAFPELFENNKIVLSEISSQLQAAYDDQQFYGNEKVVFVVRGSDLADLSEEIRSQRPIPDSDQISNFGANINLDYLTSILNSTLLQFYFQYAVSDGLNVYPDDVRYLPIADADDQERLAELGKQVSRVKDDYSRLNLDIIDYLGNYEEVPNLPDIGIFHPTDQNMLNATADDYEKLQIERARTKRDGPSVTIEATARYKPENKDEFETDTYDYTETKFFEAFTLTNLSEEEVALVEAFVPVAVGEEIANFSDNATKNISLLDRLKAIGLPDPDDVGDDLRRYVETRERADELDEKIKKTDQLIDEIVYDLYDLTDEEIEVVEEAVADD